MNGKSNSLIHWFPGHMTKSLREMQANLPLADVVLYVLDARAPQSCFNPSFDEMVGDKPVVYVLNKADLVPSSAINLWKSKLSKGNKVAVAVNASSSGSTKILLPIIEKIAHEKLERYRAKGVKVALRGMVIGVPNSGKSTLINNFCAKAKTVTGNRPGVTRGKQWVRVNDYFELLDTPGTLYPKLSDQQAALHLAYIGSIKDGVTDIMAISVSLLKHLLNLAPNALKERYNIIPEKLKDPDIDGIENFSMDALEQKSIGEQMLECVAVCRGLVQRGGVADIEKAAVAVLDDFRKGRLGKIILD